MLQLYKNIKERRLKLGLTQSELAKRMGYSDKSMIAKIEKGQVDLPQSKIVSFASALNTSPSDLMGWEEESSSNYYLDPEAAEMAQELYERPEMRILFDASRKATKEDIEQVADILKKLSGK